MTKNNPHCPTCQGRGWYMGPYYGNLQPSVEMQACPRCTTVGKPSRWELAFLAFAFILLFTLMIVGAM